MVNQESLASYLIRDVRPPSKKDLDSDLEWISRSLGLVEVRDKERSAMKIFSVMVKTANEDRVLASDEISRHVNLSRGAVISHLNRMMASGLAIHQQRGYELRMRSIEKTVDEIEKDICRVLQNIKEIARDVDQRLGLRYRR